MGSGHEMHIMDKAPRHSEMEAPSKEQRDAQVLARLGKKSVLEVNPTHIEVDRSS